MDEFTLKNADAYDKISEKWQSVRSQLPMNECIIKFCRMLKPNAKILDVGCGTGYPIDKYLSDNGYLVKGIDISEKMIEKARLLNLQNADFEQCDFLSYQNAEQFDAIIAFDSLWHIPVDRQPEIYKKAATILKSGGHFLFTHGNRTDTCEGEMFGEKFYYAALDEGRLTELLRKNAFEIVQIETNFKEETSGTRDLFAIVIKL